MSGASVYSAILANTEDSGVVYVVKDTDGIETTYTPSDVLYSSDSWENMDELYSSGKYLGSVVRNSQGEITEVFFKQLESAEES